MKNEIKAINYTDDFPIEVIFNKQLQKKTFVELEDGRNWWFKECDPYINFLVPKMIDLDQPLCGNHNGEHTGVQTNSDTTQASGTGSGEDNGNGVNISANKAGNGVKRILVSGSRKVKTVGVFVVIENNNDEDLDFEAIFKVKGNLKIKNPKI